MDRHRRAHLHAQHRPLLLPADRLLESGPDHRRPGALGYILGPGTGGLVDETGDAAADPGRLFSLTVDVSACAAASGSTLNPGEPLFFALRAVAPAGGLGGGESEQQFWVAVP